MDQAIWQRDRLLLQQSSHHDEDVNYRLYAAGITTDPSAQKARIEATLEQLSQNLPHSDNQQA